MGRSGHTGHNGHNSRHRPVGSMPGVTMFRLPEEAYAGQDQHDALMDAGSVCSGRQTVSKLAASLRAVGAGDFR
jgi:hypothetical protein